MHFWRRVASAAVVLALGAGLTVSGPSSPASAATGGCYGASCNGLDPTNRCDGDAITVRAMAVTDGMLELRYSRSCASNWGRYTPYARTVSAYAAMSIGIWARVTVWNPGRPSYGTAHHADFNIYASSWSYMTDGRPAACTGVEVVYSHNNGEYDSTGWTWGPCY